MSDFERPTQYPIVITNGDTIYIMGEFEEPGTDAWFAEKDRIQTKYREFEALEAARENEDDEIELDLTRS